MAIGSYYTAMQVILNSYSGKNSRYAREKPTNTNRQFTSRYIASSTKIKQFSYKN